MIMNLKNCSQIAKMCAFNTRVLARKMGARLVTICGPTRQIGSPQLRNSKETISNPKLCRASWPAAEAEQIRGGASRSLFGPLQLDKVCVVRAQYVDQQRVSRVFSFLF